MRLGSLVSSQIKYDEIWQSDQQAGVLHALSCSTSSAFDLVFGDHVDLITAEKIGTIVSWKECRDCGIEHAQAARKAAKCGQKHTLMIGNEAWAHDPSAARFHARFRMKMTGDFGCLSVFVRQVSKDGLLDDDGFCTGAAEVGWRRGIVVAGNPDPIMARSEHLQLRPIGIAKASTAIWIVKAVAEADHAFG